MFRVCHMTSAHGIEDDRIFHKECVSLAKAGYEVYLVERGESYEKDGVHIIGVGEIPASRRRRMTEGAKRVYEAAKQLDADIYHFHDPELLPYGLKLKKAGKKVIFDSHEFYREQIREKNYLPAWLRRIASAVYGGYENFVLRRCDAVISPCTLSGVSFFEKRCRRSAIISNAAVLGEFFNLCDLSAPKRPRQICYAGGLTEARGITADILAAYHAGAKLALAGDFSPPEYRAQLESMPEYSCVDHRGKLTLAGVRALMNESCVGLCTLLDVGQYLKLDTFGIKVYEYMSMALPVILSHSPYNDRMAAQYRFGLCVDPSNVDEIADAILYLLDHPDEARQMGENGRRAVKEEFNWGVEEKKLLTLYDEILNKK